MKQKSSHPRKEFAIFILASGIIFAFVSHLQGEEITKLLGDFAIPLPTQLIPGPDENCFGIVFSPINNQVAYVTGINDRQSLYISAAEQTDSFDLLWEAPTDSCVIRDLSWSPNGQEIAFIVKEIGNQTIPKSAKYSVYIYNVVSREVRQPIIIGNNIGKVVRQDEYGIYRNILSWWGNSFVCIPSENGSVLKFDAHTGQTDTLIMPQEGFFICSIASTRSGELRFVKFKKFETSNDVEFHIGGLGQDSVIKDYINLNQQLGQITNARLSQNGEFVFVMDHRKKLKSLPSFSLSSHIIYKIESRSVIGQIPAVIDTKKEMYYYMPLDVQNDNELILNEGRSPEVDGGNSRRNPIMRVSKMTISPDKQYKTAEN
jgi:hypothetical protein